MKIKEIISHLKTDYVFRRFVWSSVSFLLTTIFLVYNLLIGVLYKSVWNFSISFYYLILIILRFLIFGYERKWQNTPQEILSINRRKLFRWICLILGVLNVVLVAPVIVMVNGQRPVLLTMIPAIGVAAYTTYNIISSIVDYKKSKRYPHHLSLYALNIINLMDAIVSVLTLQNTLIMVFGDAASMRTLSIYTSAGMLAVMLVITIIAFRRTFLKNKE